MKSARSFRSNMIAAVACLAVAGASLWLGAKIYPGHWPLALLGAAAGGAVMAALMGWLGLGLGEREEDPDDID